MKIMANMIGSIVKLMAPMRNRDPMPVVGRITAVKLTVVDGYGYERDVSVQDAELGSWEDQATYWKDRAGYSERLGYGHPLGDPVPMGVPGVTDAPDLRAEAMERVGEVIPLTVRAGESIAAARQRALHKDMTVSQSIARGHVLTLSHAEPKTASIDGNLVMLPAGRYVYFPES